MRRRRKRQGEDNTGTERWLLTYADLLTLLLGLFVILYAMSKIDAGKYSSTIAAFGGIFGTPPAGVLEGSLNAIAPPVPDMVSRRRKVTEALESALAVSSRNGSIAISHSERGVTVHIMDELLFSSGSAELKPAAILILDSLVVVLNGLPFDVRIEGHTDNVPIKSALFESNWHLSVARAVNAAYYMIEDERLKAERVSVVGFAEYRPIADNDSEETRAKNRRVDIVIVTNLANGEQQ